MARAAASSIVFSFLPEFIQRQGGGTLDEVFKVNFISSICGVPGSIVGYFLIRSRLGRRFTLSITSFLAMISFIVFTVKTDKVYLIVASSSARFLSDMFSSVIYTYTVNITTCIYMFANCY